MEVDSVGIIAILGISYITTRIVKVQTSLAKIPRVPVENQMGGGQNLERPNVEQPIFRKFETSNIEMTKVELFDFLFPNVFFIFMIV